MASSPKLLCLFFLLCSLQTYARDSQFFSKVTRNRDDTTTTTTPNTNNNYFTSNKEEDFVPLNKQEKQDEQPTFLPQTTETGYGLYGHETGLDAPSTTTTSLYNMDENTNKKHENFNNYYKNNNDKNYATELKGLSDTTTNTENSPIKDLSYSNGEGKFYENNNKNENFNNYYMNNNEYHEKNYEPESKGFSSYNNGEGKYYGASRYNGAVEKQGMSDTRFMENGKYYYDVDAEKKYDNPTNNYMSYNNNYNTNGYYGNKETNYEEVYNHNKNYNNKFYNGNGMQEEEFDFDQP